MNLRFSGKNAIFARQFNLNETTDEDKSVSVYRNTIAIAGVCAGTEKNAGSQCL
jgi:hypothetical protein